MVVPALPFSGEGDRDPWHIVQHCKERRGIFHCHKRTSSFRNSLRLLFWTFISQTHRQTRIFRRDPKVKHFRRQSRYFQIYKSSNETKLPFYIGSKSLPIVIRFLLNLITKHLTLCVQHGEKYFKLRRKNRILAKRRTYVFSVLYSIIFLYCTPLKRSNSYLWVPPSPRDRFETYQSQTYVFALVEEDFGDSWLEEWVLEMNVDPFTDAIAVRNFAEKKQSVTERIGVKQGYWDGMMRWLDVLYGFRNIFC